MGVAGAFSRRVGGATPEPPTPPPEPPVLVDRGYPGTWANRYTVVPHGVILHGSRSGKRQSIAAEYRSTAGYATQTDLGWHATLGERVYAVHMDAYSWGWNARAASSRYLAVEFAQPTEADAITDGQVDAFVAWFRDVALRAWPSLPRNFPTHAEVEARGETGAWDGKSDVFSNGSLRTDELRDRIWKRLLAQGLGG